MAGRYHVLGLPEVQDLEEPVQLLRITKASQRRDESKIVEEPSVSWGILGLGVSSCFGFGIFPPPKKGKAM